MAPCCAQIDQTGKFQEANFQKAMGRIGAAGDAAAQTAVKTRKRTDEGEESEIFHLAKLLIGRSLDPVRRLPHLRKCS